MCALAQVETGRMAATGTGSGLRILLVDDDPHDRALVEQTLRKEFGRLAVEHIGAATALANALERGDFDLVITDYHLHWTSGLSVLVAVKERRPDLPVVMYTGTGSEEIAVQLMRAGLDDYVLKAPDHRVRLAAAVRAALARAAERRKVREAEARIRGLARFPDENPNPVLRLSADGVVIYANEASAEVLASWECRIGSKAPVPWPEIVRQALAGVMGATVDVSSGETLWSFTVAPIPDAGHVNLYGRDITESVRAERELERRSAHLEAITSTSRALRVARTPQEMFPIILDQLLALTGAGGSVIGRLDQDRRELITELGRGLWSGVTGERRLADEGMMGRVIATRTSLFVANTRQEPGLPPRDLLARLNAMALVPLIVEDRVIGVVGIGREDPFTEDETGILTAIAEIAAIAINRAGITETLEQRVRERTSELEIINERLKDLDRLKSDFVSNVSHELRTPIANILLYLDLLSEPERADRGPTYLGILKGEAERLRILIEDLLTLSRIERGKLPLEMEPHALDPLIAEVITAHAARATLKQVRFEYEPEPRLPVVWVSRAQIQQVITNLVANAVAYSPPGGVVEVRASPGDHRGQPHVLVRVHNSGPAISSEDLPHLFERFYRGRNARSNGEPGSGLGLSICKEIVELHKGWIEVESREGFGTAFTIWLPQRGEAY